MKLDDHLDKETLTLLVQKLKIGDTTVVEKIIKSHLKLAIKLVNKFVNEYNCKYLVEDLIGDALCVVCAAVFKASKGALTDDNITAYIMSHVKFALLKTLRESPLVPVPGTTMREKGIKPPRKLYISDYIAQSSDTYDLMEAINCAIKTDTEKKIVTLRIQGFTDREISEQLGLSMTNIYETRKRIERRFYAG